MSAIQAFERGDVRSEYAEPDDRPVVSGPLKVRSEEDVEFVKLWGGQFGLLALDGNDDAFLATWRRCKAARRRQNHGSIFTTHVAAVGFSERDCNILEREHGIKTVEQYLQADIGHLEATPGLGPCSTRNMLCKLCKYLLRLVLEAEQEIR